jgi:hypothetical protein
MVDVPWEKAASEAFFCSFAEDPANRNAFGPRFASDPIGFH